MNKQTKKLFLFLSLCLFSFLLSGCLNKEEKSVKDAVEKELNQLKSNHIETIQNCITAEKFLPYYKDTKELEENVTSIFTLFYKDFSYKIEKITVEDNEASAKVKFSVIDTQKLAKDFSKASLEKHIEQDAAPTAVEFSIRDSYLLLEKLLQKNTYKTKDITASLSLEKEKEIWKVLHTPKLQEALTGNFLSYVTDCNLLSPKEIVNTHFNSIKQFDAEQMKIYLSLDNLLDTEDEYSNSIVHAIAQQISKCFDFKILGEKKEDAEAVVTASIVSANFHSIMETYKEELSKWLETSESLAVGSEGRRQKEQEMLLSCIENNQNTVSHDVEIHLINDGVNWKIQMNEEIAEAVFGNIQEELLD